jgi:hypothetical protein
VPTKAPPTAAATKTPSAKAQQKPRGKVGAAQGCAGELKWLEVTSCGSIAQGEAHTYSLTSATAQQIVLVAVATTVEMGLDAVLAGPETSCVVSVLATPCQLGPVGPYTLTVRNNTEGTGTYQVSAASVPDSTCNTLTAADLSPAAAGRPSELPEGLVANCFQFSGTAGDVLRFGAPTGMARVYDAAGAEICQPTWWTTLRCSLTGGGPYRAFITQQMGSSGAYTFRLAKVNAPTGCATLQPAPFGAPGSSAASGSLTPRQTTCRSIEVAAGLHDQRLASNPNNGSGVIAEIYDHDGELHCSDAGQAGCQLAAGVYTVLLENNDDAQDTSYDFSLIPLGRTTGCAAAVGTSWDLPVLSVTRTSPVQLDCRPINAVAGERILARTPEVDARDAWATTRIVDAEGAAACPADYDHSGCVLTGTGPFKVLSSIDAHSGATGYRLDIGRLSEPVGCVPAVLSKFGTVAPTGPAGSRCRELTVGAKAVYRIDPRADDGETLGLGAYGIDGTRRCEGLLYCELEPGKYTVLAADSVRIAIFPLTSTDGCTAQPTDSFAATAGTLAGPSQYDCLRLNAPAAAQVQPTEATDRSVTEGIVVDATGATICSWGSTGDWYCKLTGAAPFRAVIHRRADQDGSSYRLAVPRIDTAAGCPTLPQSDFTSTGGTTVTLRPDRFSTCFAVPAGSHASWESVQYKRTGSVGSARMVAVTAGSDQRCDEYAGPARHVFCSFDPAKTYTIMLVGSDMTAGYQISRRDITSNAKGCSAISSSTIGATAGTGTIADESVLRCFKFSSATTDRFLINTRGASSIGAAALRSTGEPICKTFDELRCLASGSTGWQVMVWMDESYGPAGSFKLETARISTAAGPAAECVKAPSSAYGFGPFTGEVTAAKTTACVTFQLGRYDRFDGTADNQVSGGVVPYLYTRSVAGADNCMWSTVPSGNFTCYGGETPVADVMLVNLPETETSLKYKVLATCEHPLCGGAVFAAKSVAPSSAVVGATALLTIKGSALHPRDVVRLTGAGKPAITGTMRSVTADRTTSVYAFNLAGAALGVRDVVVDSFAGSSVTLAKAFTVLGAAPKATKAPVLYQTPQVNHTVAVTAGTWSPTCTSYGYQWYSGGAAIAGATKTTLLLKAATANKSLYAAVTCARTGHVSGRAVSNTVTVRP